uniref:G-protein coupled receptors family 1 profile domain-containing protein n=1 Tax=Oncorhynchus kisutch TaxID=8019 RepID=A0A8C7HNW2_ONCKI
MENHTFSMDLLKLEGVKVIYQSTYPAFILLLIIYIFTMVANIGLTVLICMERSLHHPMYILLCNMSFNDALSITTIIPRVLFDILTPRSDRYITYNECFTQAFLGHWFGSNFHTILMIMAFDRSEIINPWCDNASLFKLSCESVLINNIYGLFFTTIFFIASMGSVALTYIRITMVCVRSKSKSLNSKALHTCFTHLAVYLIMLMTGFIIVFLHRYPEWSDHRKLASIMFYVVPPALNPIIYGLQSKDIRKLVVNISHCKKVSP